MEGHAGLVLNSGVRGKVHDRGTATDHLVMPASGSPAAAIPCQLAERPNSRIGEAATLVVDLEGPYELAKLGERLLLGQVDGIISQAHGDELLVAVEDRALCELDVEVRSLSRTNTTRSGESGLGPLTFLIPRYFSDHPPSPTVPSKPDISTSTQTLVSGFLFEKLTTQHGRAFNSCGFSCAGVPFDARSMAHF